jgi:hypothetical protein
MKKLKFNRKIFLEKNRRRKLRLYLKRKDKKILLSTLEKNLIKKYKTLNKSERLSNSKHKVEKKLEAPEYFNLQFENCEHVIKFINTIKRIDSERFKIFIDLNKVKSFGEGAISMLLSVIEEHDRKGGVINGNFPIDNKARRVLETSGFFSYMFGNHDHINKSKNTILRTGGVKNEDRQIIPELWKANETVWGEKGRNPAIRGAIVEMIRNSCDHAFKNTNKTIWHLGVWHDENLNVVKFSFVDNGNGILSTLSEGKLKDFINVFKDNIDIIESAFHDGINSRTGLKWRGKGLPNIFEYYKDGYFSNLVIITNDVYIDFDNNIREKLENQFKGTYYYFKLNKSCLKACFN